MVVKMLAVAFLVFVLSASSAAARSPHARKAAAVTPAISLNQSSPAFGDSVTFTVVSDLADPWVSVYCAQGSLGVYGQYWDYSPTYDNGLVDPSQDTTVAWGGVFTLGPTALWAGGAASCTAELSDSTPSGVTVLASVAFSVSG